MICQYRIEGTCQLADTFLQKVGIIGTVKCNNDAFEACSKCGCSHTYNYVVGSLTYTYLIEKKIQFSSIQNDLINLIKLGPICKIGGPGTELKKILIFLKIFSDSTCDCEWHARQMDMWGSQECIKRVGEIVEWLRVESERLKWGWTFNKFAVATLIILACKLADGDSWTSILLKLPSCYQLIKQ